MTVISASSLGKTYEGGTAALKELNLRIDPGEVFGLLGPNGAGKTTTVRLLNGTLEASQGTVSIFGREPGAQEVRSKIATLAEQAKMYEHLTAEQNLEFFADMYGMERTTRASRITELLGRMGLEGREKDKVGTYSTGMRKRLQLARVLLPSPELVFLDEPTSGLDPDAARQVTDLIRSLAADAGITVFLCTHNLVIAERVCDTFGFLSRGSLIAHGTKAELVANAGDQISLNVTTATRSHSIELEDEREVNDHIRRIMDAGESIRDVRLNDPDLESLYFRYVGRSTNELG